MTADLASARMSWEEGHRRLLDAARDPGQREVLHAQVAAISAELRKRVGGAFTLAELAEAYANSERWAREAVAERASSSGWPRTLAVAGDTAFHLYARGAVDYEP